MKIDLRSGETDEVIWALRKYLEVMEQQMPVIQECERASMERARPPLNEDEEQSIFTMELNFLERLFEQHLIPTMRYSFVVFLHTIFETQLRSFCAEMQRDRKLALDLRDIQGSAIDQVRVYLGKFVGIKVEEFPEWQHLRAFQMVRDCIVHHYGHLSPNSSRSGDIRNLAKKNIGLSILHEDRIFLDRSFCEQHLTHIESFFRSLFQAAGWIP